ncbi:hypothetical protein [Microbispora sp. NPDC049125]|uniref:hypothetical protein n=1 Tax=Microbispora sp. NPDC049125 TaxID=3154929 RepID=UPI003466DC2B
MNELTRMDEMSLTGAALRGAPWGAAAISGGAIAVTSFLMGVVLPGPADLTWALCSGITLFALVAGIGAISKPDQGDRVTRQARNWALTHPWRFAMFLGLGAAALMYPVQFVVDGEGFFGAAWDAMWGGLMVLLVTAFITHSMRGRARRS